jgi:hypothetical protein
MAADVPDHTPADRAAALLAAALDRASGGDADPRKLAELFPDDTDTPDDGEE